MTRKRNASLTGATISKADAVAAAAAGLLPPGQAAKAAGISPRHLRTLRARARTDPDMAARVATAAEKLTETREATAAAVLAAARAALDHLTETAHEASWTAGGAAQAVRLVQTWQTLTGQASQITEARSIAVDLTAAAVRAVTEYRRAGYTEAEALACLSEDDHELWRAYPHPPGDPTTDDPTTDQRRRPDDAQAGDR